MNADYMHMKKLTLWSCFVFFFAVKGTSAAEPLLVHGETYPNACEDSQLSKLRQETFEVAGELNPHGAWRVIKTILCGTDRARERLLGTNFPELIAVKNASTGDTEETKTLVDRGAVSFPINAWGASVSRWPDDLTLSYQPNEACIQSFGARFTGKDWLVVSSGETCD